jgi:hypothetical protein
VTGNETDYVLWPYLKVDFVDGRAWVRDARSAAAVECAHDLLAQLQLFSRPAPLSALHAHFGVPDVSAKALVDAGLLVPAPVSGTNPPADARVGIVSTMRYPGAPLRSFLEYHSRRRIERIYLFLEDSDDPAFAIADEYPQVTAVLAGAELRAQQADGPLWTEMGPYVHTEVMARQCLNAQTALELASRDGIEWLAHIDADELIFTPCDLPSYLARLPRDVGQVLCLNYEGVPESLEVADPFLEVTLFRKPVPLCRRSALRSFLDETGRKSWFIAYGQGKAIVRVADDVITTSVHEFRPTRRGPLTVTSMDPCVLHYPRCGFSRFRARYVNEVRPGELCFGLPATRTPAGAGAVPTARIAFDIRAGAAFRQDEANARSLYRDEVMLGGSQQVARLLRDGLCVRLLDARDITLSSRGGHAASPPTGPEVGGASTHDGALSAETSA